MHEKVFPFVSKTLSKITTIIYISTKISGFKNTCNEKTGFIFSFFLTVKNDTVDQKSAKYAMKKINLHLKRFTLQFLLFFIQTLETVLHITTQIRGQSAFQNVLYSSFRASLRTGSWASMRQGRISSVNPEFNKTFMFPSFK